MRLAENALLALTLATAACTDPAGDIYHAAGTAYVPVVVHVQVEGATTDGMQVTLVDAGEDQPAQPDATPALRALHDQLGKTKLTDGSSTATVWFHTTTVESGTDTSSTFTRHLRGRLLVGPPDAPYLDTPLVDLLPDPDATASSPDPIYVEAPLPRERLPVPE